MTYERADEILKGRAHRKVAGNTYLRKDPDGTIALRLHATDILTWTPDGKITYDSGGWKTPTTKDRLNEWGPARISQRGGIWYFEGDGIFEDGCYWLDGQMYGTRAVETAKKDRGMIKTIQHYARNYVHALLNREIPAPSAGDCFYCVMKTQEGIPLGETTKDTSHLLSHFEEPYYVPSLVTNAIEKFPISIMAKYIFAYLWNPAHQNDDIPDSIRNIAERQIYLSLVKYLKRQFGIAR